MKNYIQKIRLKIGQEKFIHPAARIIVENKNKEVLIIERVDNGLIGIPAGSIEENETIEECIIREVREETGLKIIKFHCAVNIYLLKRVFNHLLMKCLMLEEQGY